MNKKEVKKIIRQIQDLLDDVVDGLREENVPETRLPEKPEEVDKEDDDDE